MSLLLFLLLGLGVFWIAVVLYTAWMLTHPPRRTYASAVARGKPGDPGEMPRPRQWREWTFRSRGLELPAWDIAGDRPDGPTVVMVHGWGDSRIGALARLEAVAPAASRVIAWDLPGHGEAPSRCQLGTAEIDHLLELLRLLAAERIVLFGWSLGAGVSLAAAARVQVAAVIAETPYRLPATPARNVLRLRGLPYRATLLPALALISLFQGRSLSTAKFDRAGHAAAATCPVLVLHGDLDEVCPLADGQSIAQSAPHGQTAIIRGGSHNALWSDPSLREQCTRAVQQFLEEAVAPTPTPS